MITLDPQQVLRWRAYKHNLVQRAPRRELVEVVTRVGGLQAQMMSAAELQLWARVEGVTLQEIRDAIWKERSLVKSWAWRGTLFLLAADHYWTYVAALSTRTRH